ncbi:hypothetical protein PGT21_021345 [Puccinia graminis f. sp. tritici]|uniref:Uncharacterized protein n=1 Tax=Puccinia graminis f. sp. tritici TaxID=56615 RepID=A0A5B0PRN0_PUCGR|nr:hypothetical protein PGT21_021345 [Puccinia graminis f. sp. tritici]
MPPTKLNFGPKPLCEIVPCNTLTERLLKLGAATQLGMVAQFTLKTSREESGQSLFCPCLSSSVPFPTSRPQSLNVLAKSKQLTFCFKISQIRPCDGRLLRNFNQYSEFTFECGNPDTSLVGQRVHHSTRKLSQADSCKSLTDF